MFKWGVFVVLAAMLCAAAQAKETTPRIATLHLKDHGVLGVMHRMGCNPKWLSVVMRRSEIIESDLNSLQEGTRIVIPYECRNSVPTRRDARISGHILAQESKTQHNTQKTEENLRGQLNEKIAQLEYPNQNADSLEKQKSELLIHLMHAEQATKLLEEYKNSNQWRNLLLGGAIGSMLTFATLWLSFIRQLRQRNQTLQNNETKTREELLEGLAKKHANPLDPVFSITYRGRIVKFEDTSVRTAKCPYCSEKNLMPRTNNLRQHLDKCHVHLRLIEQTPENMRGLFKKAVA
jgi:hypothetical protein